MSSIGQLTLRILDRLLYAALFSVLVTVIGSAVAAVLEQDWSPIFFAPVPTIAIYLAGLFLAPVLKPLFSTLRK